MWDNMKTPLEENEYREILESVRYVSQKAMNANHYLHKIHETLKNDERIVYDYMKQHQTFLNTVEYGVPLRGEGNDLTSALRKDLSHYSGGNSEVVQDYLKDSDFMNNVYRGHKLRSEITYDAIELEEVFTKHRYPVEQRGVANIIHKAEHDLYDVFTHPDKIDKELRKELEELVRHEPYQKSKEEIEQDRKALAELKERQAINKALREERKEKREYERFVKDYHERKAVNEEKTSKRQEVSMER